VPAGLFVCTSNRLEDLLEVLAGDLAREPLPPLAPETVVVPGQGLARWLTLHLAERHGIAAGLDLPFPGAFLGNLLARADAAADLFAADVLPWRIWRLLGDADLQPEFGPAALYCRDDPDGQRRLQLCTRLAARFDDYQLYRDDLLLRASAGDDLEELGEHGPWQARLWRALLRDAGAGAAAPHRLERLRKLLADPGQARPLLPPRLSVFGTGTLPPAFLDLLLRVAALVPVRLYLPQPAPAYFADQRARGGDAGANPLLARLGAEAAEFQDLLVDLEERAAVPCQRTDLPAADDPPRSLLACLQHDVAAVAARGDGEGALPRFPLAAGDDSVRVHDCHSPQRELEVVRDQILAAFAADPQLQAHEVLVLVPDVERYAPYAQAVFGPVREHLPFHVADKAPASELPLCGALFDLLQLARGRLQVADVLHLLELPAVHRRSGIAAADLPALRARCERAGIRWGRDGAWRHRHFDLPAFDANSWRQGLDRLLLGAATGPEPDLVAGLLPVADATSSRDELLARFCGFADSLFAALEQLQRPEPLDVWADRVDALLAGFFAAADAEDELAALQVQRATARLRRLAAEARLREPVALPVLQDWLRAALRQGVGNRGFCAGAVTVAAMLPMRTVPVRHLFLCGLDDASFPRRDQPEPFDLVAAAARRGDRSTRLDDRQLFLDAVLAARQRLHLTFVGHSQKDDSACAPSAVLAELLDTIDRSCAAPPGFASARAAVYVRHPLQPWSRRYRDGADPRLFTYAPVGEAVAPGSADEPAWCGAALPGRTAPAAGELPIARLLGFWQKPARFFLLHALGVGQRRGDEADGDDEPMELGALQRWQLADERVRTTLRGVPPRDPLARAHATGLLPVGGLGAIDFAAVADASDEFVAAVRAHGRLASRSLCVPCDGWLVRGEVDGVGVADLVRARIAAIKDKDRLAAWILHVLLAAARHRGERDLPATTRIVGADGAETFAALGPRQAADCLSLLLRGFREGHLLPLPVFEHASPAYAAGLCGGGGSPAEALRRARAAYGPAGEAWRSCDTDEPANLLCARGRDALADPAFARWAGELWTPLREHLREEP